MEYRFERSANSKPHQAVTVFFFLQGKWGEVSLTCVSMFDRIRDLFHPCLSYDLLSSRIVNAYVNDAELRCLQRVIIASYQNATLFQL